jgi:hypothetical protein
MVKELQLAGGTNSLNTIAVVGKGSGAGKSQIPVTARLRRAQQAGRNGARDRREHGNRSFRSFDGKNARHDARLCSRTERPKGTPEFA